MKETLDRVVKDSIISNYSQSSLSQIWFDKIARGKVPSLQEIIGNIRRIYIDSLKM